jgi:hypothetical protein
LGYIPVLSCPLGIYTSSQLSLRDIYQFSLPLGDIITSSQLPLWDIYQFSVAPWGYIPVISCPLGIYTSSRCPLGIYTSSQLSLRDIYQFSLPLGDIYQFSAAPWRYIPVHSCPLGIYTGVPRGYKQVLSYPSDKFSAWIYTCS